MNDHPYTTADEDPFNVQPIVQQVKSIKHPHSSLLDKWILEQQQNPTQYPNSLHLSNPCFSASDASKSFSNPYLAYPDLPRVTPFDTTEKEDTGSINSYDFVNDDDIPDNAAPDGAVSQDPSISIPPRTTKSFRHSLTPSFRNLNLPFRSPTSSNTDASSSRAFSRLSIFQRTPRSSIDMCSDNNASPSSILNHNRSISQRAMNLTFHSPRTTPRWRPSVLGHFYQPSASQSSILVSDSHSTPSRPSISSADTYNTSSTSRTATTVESNLLSTPPKLPDSIGSRNTLLTAALNLPTASGSSVRLPGHGSDNGSHGIHCQMLSRQRTPFTPELDDNALVIDDDDDDMDSPPTFCARHHDTIRPSIPYSSTGTLPRVKFSSLNTRSQRKKKKLVISGIGISEVRKLEGIKRWCESFGEVSQITRMPNGDLYVDFRDSEVADTVCRVRAKVHITGVGSVQLSWFAGHKR